MSIGIGSLGQTLLNGEEYKDFELIVTDGKLKVAVGVHRLVLKTCSPFFARTLGGSYFFFYIWTVPEGSIAAALRLVKFFYTRDLRDLGDLEQTLTLCLALEAADIYNLLNQVRSVAHATGTKRKRVRIEQARRLTRSLDRPPARTTRSHHS